MSDANANVGNEPNGQNQLDNQQQQTGSNQPGGQNDAGNDKKPMFSWLRGLGNDKEPGTQQQQQTQTSPGFQQQQQQQPGKSSEERLQDFINGIPVANIQLNQEEFNDFRENGNLEKLNEHLANGQRQMYMHMLSTVNDLVKSGVEDAKKEMLAQANVNNISKDILDHVKSEYFEAAGDPVLGPVLESMVSVMLKNGETDRNKITEAAGDALEHMAGKLGKAFDKKEPGQSGDSNIHEPDNWTDFVKNQLG